HPAYPHGRWRHGGAYRRMVVQICQLSELCTVFRSPALRPQRRRSDKKISWRGYYQRLVLPQSADTFQQEGGGKDFEDVFIYWFDKDSYQLDYLAYYYNTDETGIRFREAYNRQTVDGILFQDYINYAPIDSTITVHQTDDQLEKGLLKELSRIENEKLESLK
ncbi:MAG: DUF6503 family protein, partial [Imperialibacter sp.]